VTGQAVLPAQAGARKRRVALLGAPGTGKTTLAAQLAAHLCASGLAAVAVPDPSRERGFAPGAEERLASAREHERRVDAALVAADLVVADAPALMAAIHAGTLSDDDALLRFAIERQRRYDLSLLTGLDLACTPDGAAQVDALVRDQLQRAQVPYQVVYGQGAQRLQSALQALAAAGWLPQPPRAERARGTAWVWTCEKCSDPACEHRLFTQLKDRGN